VKHVVTMYTYLYYLLGGLCKALWFHSLYMWHMATTIFFFMVSLLYWDSCLFYGLSADGQTGNLLQHALGFMAYCDKDIRMRLAGLHRPCPSHSRLAQQPDAAFSTLLH